MTTAKIYFFYTLFEKGIEISYLMLLPDIIVLHTQYNLLTQRQKSEFYDNHMKNQKLFAILLNNIVNS